LLGSLSSEEFALTPYVVGLTGAGLTIALVTRLPPRAATTLFSDRPHRLGAEPLSISGLLILMWEVLAAFYTVALFG